MPRAEFSSSAVLDQNRRAWDAFVRKKQCFTTPAPDDDLHEPLATADGLGWLGWPAACAG